MAWHKGDKFTEQHRKHLSEALKKAVAEGRLVPPCRGKRLSKEHRQKISQAKKKYFREHPEARKRNTEHWRRYFQTHDCYWKGKTIPQEILEKQIAGRLKYYETHNAPNRGIPHSQETKDKIRKSALKAGVGKWNKGLKRSQKKWTDTIVKARKKKKKQTGDDQ